VVTRSKRNTKSSPISPAHLRIAILDAGSQYGGLIDRNVRSLGFRTSLLPLDTPIEQLEEFAAVIISGGPKSVGDKDAYWCDPRVVNLRKPLLGICYGMQLIAKLHGGEVGPSSLREDGPQLTEFTSDSRLTHGLAGPQKVLMSHGDSVKKVPTGFVISGGVNDNLISAIENPEIDCYGVQFHPEVFQTECGDTIFRNFLYRVAGLKPDYTADDQEAEAIKYIKDAVGDNDVLVFVSGGVDSAVLAALIARAIKPSKIHAFHIDTGLMRAQESTQVISALIEAGIAVTLLNESKTFYNATTTIDGLVTLPLFQATDPQMKRKIIGDTFIKVRGEILKREKLSAGTVLAQGSLRPDLIESGSHLASTKADIIKTHHNDTQAVRDLREQGRVVEPLQQLYKDQVRTLGRRLGLPISLIDRHPFPGPGLAIRILCSESAYRMPDHDKLQQQLDQFVLRDGPEFSAHLLPVRTVGVQGDGRSYKYLVGIQGPAKWDKLFTLAAKIPNNNHAINRVCYIFGEPVDRIKLGLTPTHLEENVIDQARHADDVVTRILRQHDLMNSISQMPVVLFPIDFGEPGSRSIALRPFLTPDFMTGIAARPGGDLPISALNDMVRTVLAEVPGISRVVLDMSSKPPGTTEWE
jgi:GMP synthase (glutamine-hydrolysing)